MIANYTGQNLIFAGGHTLKPCGELVAHTVQNDGAMFLSHAPTWGVEIAVERKAISHIDPLPPFNPAYIVIVTPEYYAAAEAAELLRPDVYTWRGRGSAPYECVISLVQYGYGKLRAEADFRRLQKQTARTSGL